MTTLQDKTPEELNVICAELCGVRRYSYLILLCWPDAESSNVWSSGCYDTLEKATTVADELVRNGRVLKEIKSIPLDLPPYATSYDAIMGEILRLDVPMKLRFSRKLRLIAVEVGFDPIFASPADLTRALILTLTT